MHSSSARLEYDAPPRCAFSGAVPVAAAPSGVYVLGSFKGSQLRLGATTLASDSVESTMFLAKVRRPSGR